MEFASVSSPAAAFIAGLVTSLHCAGMCGPLACAIVPVRREQGDPSTAATAYHLSRLAGYSALGALAGGLGRMPLAWLSLSALKWLPWLGVLFFLGLALRWDRRWPRIPILGRLALRFSGRFRGQPLAQAAALGLATPLFPCGPLYFLVAIALLSGSALRGAEFMLAFGLGTVPLLWLAQTQLGRVQRRLPPRWTERCRLGLALTAALVVAWRLRGTLGAAGPDPSCFLCF
ncbi:MAG TPA: sulfite exporter TauE/SafE family protein [Opitutaceae bacterium]|nr:sulfite exporter TauE/SafE family protein [Opitutaceae bacterium]